MRDKIINNLRDIEKRENIKILFALETGSRLWRIESKDSDYDVRFVYVRNANDYLRIHKLKDVLEYKIEDIDIVGFDIYKFSQLLIQSNPTIIEWLQSDIVYLDDGESKKFLLDFIDMRFNPYTLYQHYKSMCKSNYLKYLKSNNLMTYKKYLYCMRGLLNAKFVAKYNCIPSIKFEECVEDMRSIVDDNILDLLINIIEKKKLHNENKEEKFLQLEYFIEKELTKDDEVENRRIIDYKELNEFILKMVINWQVKV